MPIELAKDDRIVVVEADLSKAILRFFQNEFPGQRCGGGMKRG